MISAIRAFKDDIVLVLVLLFAEQCYFISILLFLKDINNYGKINFPYMGLLGSKLFQLVPYVHIRLLLQRTGGAYPSLPLNFSGVRSLRDCLVQK
jgi:hypothetical protein